MWGWLKALVGWPDPEVTAPSPAAGLGSRDLAAADHHVARFQRALDQCEKGPEREAELRRQLNYWQGVVRLREGDF